jgi:hypothetical protein
MTDGSRRVILVLIGALPLWLLTTMLQSLASEGPDRGGSVQLPLFVSVLLAPALAYLVRRRVRWLPSLVLVLQLVAYVAYETGISINTNIRVDLLLIYPAVLTTAWLALGATGAARNEGSP